MSAGIRSVAKQKYVAKATALGVRVPQAELLRRMPRCRGLKKMGKNHIARFVMSSPVRLLMCMSLFSSMVFYAPVSLLVRTRMGITLEEFFVLQALLSATVFFFEIPSGFLSDAIGYRQTILLSFLLNFAARVLMLLSQNFWMFAAEAVVEGLAAALNSGTISGYVYSISERDTYAVNMAEINRCSEFGFLLSTLGFSVIYQCLGMRGLLLGTAAAAFAAFLASCRLSQKTCSKLRGIKLAAQQGCGVLDPGGSCQMDMQACPAWLVARGNKSLEEKKKRTRGGDAVHWKNMIKMVHGFRVHPDMPDLVCVLGISLVSLSFLLVNFFYVTILEELGLDETYMTAVILVYTGIQILIPWIIRKRNRLQEKRSRRRSCPDEQNSLQKHLNALLTSLAAAAVLVFGLAWTESFFVLLPMILLPAALQLLQLDVETCQNLCIDRKGLSRNRVTVISGYSMVSNALEILFLFASSQIGAMGVRPLFWGLGILLLLAAGLVFRLLRKEI